MINIPLYWVDSCLEMVPDVASLWMRQYWGIPLSRIRRQTVVALNVGGGLIPAGLALYQFSRANPASIILVTIIVTAVTYAAAHVVPGIGIQMSPLLAPLTASMSAFLLANNQPAPVAFGGGVLGILIGADLLHLWEIEQRSVGILSIGGAGVFDGIALCGLLALLLT